MNFNEADDQPSVFFLYHFKWRILDENCLGELSVVWLCDVDTLPRECLKYSPMVLIVIIRIGVNVGQSHAVEFGIGERVNDLWLEMFLILWRQGKKVKFLDTFDFSRIFWSRKKQTEMESIEACRDVRIIMQSGHQPTNLYGARGEGLDRGNA